MNPFAVTLITFLSVTASIAASRAFPIDYDGDEMPGNSINSRESAIANDYQDYGVYDDVGKREPELFEGSHKRNIISALQSKIRRSKPSDMEDKLKFSPALSVGELKFFSRLVLHSVKIEASQNCFVVR